MKLTILGKYGPYPRANEGTSAYLLENNETKILFECGSGCATKLRNYVQIEKLNAIIISHAHFDHECDLGVLNYCLQFKTNSNEFSGKMSVYVPEEARTDFEYLEKECPFFNVVYVNTKDEYAIGEFTFKFYKMKHPKTTYGFTVKCQNSIFGYTADTNVCEGLNQVIENSEVILADGCCLSSNYTEKAPHLSVSVIDELAQKTNKQFIVTHLAPDIDEKEYIKEIKSNLTEIAKIGGSYII